MPLSSRLLGATAETGAWVTEDAVAGAVIVETGAVIVEAGVTPVRDALLPPKRPRLPRKILMLLNTGAATGTATGTTTGLVAGTTGTTGITVGITTGVAAGTTGTTGVITVVAGPARLIRMLRRAIGGDPMVVVGAVVETGVVAATEAGASPGVNTTKS